MPSSGTIKFKSNKNRNTFDNKKISYVPQDILILDDTLKKNIAFGIEDEKIDEAAYSEFIEDYKNTYFKEVYDVLSSKYKLGRVRILLKQPRSTLSWHRDPEPRLHIPIITNPGAIMVIDNIA